MWIKYSFSACLCCYYCTSYGGFCWRWQTRIREGLYRQKDAKPLKPPLHQIRPFSPCQSASRRTSISPEHHNRTQHHDRPDKRTTALIPLPLLPSSAIIVQASPSRSLSPDWSLYAGSRLSPEPWPRRRPTLSVCIIALERRLERVPLASCSKGRIS